MVAMSAGQRDWTERMIAQWSARAAVLQDDPGASAAQLLRAACLEDIVRDLRGRLAAAGPAPSSDEAGRARLLADLAAIMPYAHPTVAGVMMNAGPIMAGVRNRLRAQLGLADREPEAVAPVAPRWADAPMVPPANDPEPFEAGEQMGLFG